MELELLPDHVLIEIFRGLSTHDLVNYRRVSKRWFRLISCPKYFQRAHHLQFYGCTLSATCLPLSIFKTSSQPFFRFLRIGEKVDYNEDEEQEVWKNAWSELGKRITHLTFNTPAVGFPIVSHILGDGSYWSQLIELDVNWCHTDFPQQLEIPSLKTLKLVSYDSSQYLETNFPNLQNLHINTTLGRRFSDWELQRLRAVKCNLSKLRTLNTNTVQTLSLGLSWGGLSEINSNDKKFIESFVSQQENFLELNLDFFGLPSLENWCSLTQLTGLKISIYGPEEDYLENYFLGNYFTQLENLKCIEIELTDFDSSCFFRHEPVDFPCLDEYFINADVPNQCEECWKSCLESIINAKIGIIVNFNKIKNYLHLLQNLESFTSDRIDCCLKVGDEEDRNLVVKPLPNVLKFYSFCDHETIDEEDFRTIAYCFPNLRSLAISSVKPILLKLLPGIQELYLIYFPKDMIEELVQYGKNLRMIQIYEGCGKEHTKYLFDNLELLVQVSDSHHTKVYTRSSFECQ